jgi:hypothetical protein
MVTLAAAAVDKACRTGDVAALQRATSPRYFAALAALLADDGRRLDGASLQQQKVHVGGIAQLPLLVGVAGADAAVAVLARDRAGVEHEVEPRALLALRFSWDGFTMRLDDKVSRAVPAGESVSAAARALAKELMAAR